MSVNSLRHAAALSALALAGCAGTPPAPLETGHPARPDTAAASPVSLGTLSSYRDFGVQPAGSSRGDGGGDHQHADPTPAAKESDDGHEH